MTRQVLLAITSDIDAVDIHRRIAHAFADVDGECRVSIRNTVGESLAAVEAMVDTKRLKDDAQINHDAVAKARAYVEKCDKDEARLILAFAPDQPGDGFTKAADCE